MKPVAIVEDIAKLGVSKTVMSNAVMLNSVRKLYVADRNLCNFWLKHH